MSKTPSKPKQTRRSVNDVVLVMPQSAVEPGAIELHGKGLEVSTTKPLKELEREWGTVTQQVIILLDQTEKAQSKSGFELDEVSFQLAINAKGQIGFIVGGEVGGEASITLTFKRKR